MLGMYITADDYRTDKFSGALCRYVLDPSYIEDNPVPTPCRVGESCVRITIDSCDEALDSNGNIVLHYDDYRVCVKPNTPLWVA